MASAAAASVPSIARASEPDIVTRSGMRDNASSATRTASMSNGRPALWAASSRHPERAALAAVSCRRDTSAWKPRWPSHAAYRAVEASSSLPVSTSTVFRKSISTAKSSGTRPCSVSMRRVYRYHHRSMEGNASLTAKRRIAVVCLLVAAVCWGVDTTVSEVALRRMRPGDLLLIELVSGAAGVWLAVALTRSYRRPARVRHHVLLGALEPGLLYLLFDIGLPRTSAVSAGLLLSSEGLFAVAFGVVLLGERLQRGSSVALLAGTLGAAVITTGGAAGGDTFVGDVLVLTASAAGGIYYVLARRISAHDESAGGDSSGSLAATAYQLLGALTVAIPFAANTWTTQN